jgi:hypothetical protein
MRERTYTIRGVRPIVMHNERLADPLNPHAKAVKEISKKQKKTDDDLLALSKAEFMGGLYYDSDIGPHVPERCLERMLRDAASKSKQGKAVLSALIVTDPAKLEYKGPRDPDEMWKDGSYVLRATVGVSKQRVVRSRPIFGGWSLTFTVAYDETVLNPKDIDGFVEIAGRQIGLCDWRPKYGRFDVESIK